MDGSRPDLGSPDLPFQTCRVRRGKDPSVVEEASGVKEAPFGHSWLGGDGLQGPCRASSWAHPTCPEWSAEHGVPQAETQAQQQ